MRLESAAFSGHDVAGDCSARSSGSSDEPGTGQSRRLGRVGSAGKSTRPLARILRTEVRPISNHLAISDWLSRSAFALSNETAGLINGSQGYHRRLCQRVRLRNARRVRLADACRSGSRRLDWGINCSFTLVDDAIIYPAVVD